MEMFRVHLKLAVSRISLHHKDRGVYHKKQDKAECSVCYVPRQEVLCEQYIEGKKIISKLPK